MRVKCANCISAEATDPIEQRLLFFDRRYVGSPADDQLLPACYEPQCLCLALAQDVAGVKPAILQKRIPLACVVL